jgi:hypothetical protein
LKLRLVYKTDFRKNESTNYEAAVKEHELTLRGDDVVLLVSKAWNQLIFVWRPTEMEGARGPIRVVSSRRLRLQGGSWNPLMLANYAGSVGLELNGLKLFESRYQERATK